MKNINIMNGQIKLDDISNVITPSMKKSDFLTSKLSKEIKWKNGRLNWERYVLNPLKVGGLPFTLSLRFKDDVLEFLTLSYWNGKDIDWNNWSKKDEEKKKEIHDKWLYSQLGNPPYQFSWGEVESLYVMQEAISEITFTFH